MIVLKKPQNVEAGSTVCVTASGIGKGLQVKAYAGVDRLKIRVTLDNKGSTATICFEAPPEGTVVTIEAADATSSESTLLAFTVR